jgi:hypothetical protein
LPRLLLKLSYFQSREERGHLLKVSIVVEKMEFMLDGGLDEFSEGFPQPYVNVYRSRNSNPYLN